MSTDGLIWTKGVGSYGQGWGNTGTGVTVRAGGTIYIKYYSEVEDVTLGYADHGRKSDGWRSVGPVLEDRIGTLPNEPVILRITDAGTRKCTIAWINARGKSGLWNGPQAPGPYDLALHDGATWTVPPLVIQEVPNRPSFWAGIFGGRDVAPPPRSNLIVSVPDGGATAVLFAFALLSLALLRRK